MGITVDSRSADEHGAPFTLSSRRLGLPVVVELALVAHRADQQHQVTSPALTWVLQSADLLDDAPHVAVVDPDSGRVSIVRHCDDLPRSGAIHTLADLKQIPEELTGATAVLWVSGPGHVRVSAAAHTAWLAALNRGVDAAVLVGLERDPGASVRLAALGIGYAGPERSPSGC